MFDLSPDEWTAVALSLRIAVVSTFVALPFGIAIAYLLARKNFWGKSLVDAIVHLPLVLPPVVTGYLLLITFGRKAPLGAWLADVGFGDSFREPLRFIEAVEQEQHGRAYRLDRDGEHFTLMQRDGATWEPQYRFTLQPHAHAEYADMCRYHQTAPESSFTRKRVCTLATPAGRITLSELVLIVTAEGQRTEQVLPDESAFKAALREHFDIDLIIV